MTGRTLVWTGLLAPAAVCCSALATPSLNLAQATADTKAEIARGGQADIVLLADSLAFDNTYSFRPYFTTRMQTLYGNAGDGYLEGPFFAVPYGSDWQFGVLGGSDPAPHHALNGLWLTAPGGGRLPSAAAVFPSSDKFDIHYAVQPGGGAFDLVTASTGQFVTHISTAADALSARAFHHDFPGDAPGVMCMQADGRGPVTILGVNRTNDDTGVRVHRAANGGWGIDHYLRRDSTFDAQLNLLGTDLVMVSVGVNDSLKPRDEFVQKLNLLVDRIQAAVPSSEIVLVAPYDYGAAAPVIASATEEVAATRGVGLINLYETAGSHAFFESQGYLSDGVHFTVAGGNYVGNLLFEAFRTNGAAGVGQVPEPASTCALAAAAALLALRRPSRFIVP